MDTSPDVVSAAIKLLETNGIIFIDEIDKLIAAPQHHPGGGSSGGGGGGPDASSVGVQRDLLPFLSGTNVTTPFGPVSTHNITFITAGAFAHTTPSQLIPELQGRLPLRVELEKLTAFDYYHIMLLEDKTNVLMQNVALLHQEGLTVNIHSNAVWEMALTVELLNEVQENVGARRVTSVVEHLFKDLHFFASNLPSGSAINMTQEFVQDKCQVLFQAAAGPGGLAGMRNKYAKYLL